jgi:flagellar biosynthesis/type III secretory pathway protein FliH
MVEFANYEEVKAYDDGYEEGYKIGFQEGWEEAKTELIRCMNLIELSDYQKKR